MQWQAPSPKQTVDNCKVSKSFLVGTYIHWILSGRNDRGWGGVEVVGGPICLFRDVASCWNEIIIEDDRLAWLDSARNNMRGKWTKHCLI